MSNVAYTPNDAPRSVAKPSRVLICRNGECHLPLKFGIYFDGTNNNRELDMPSLSHSNVAKLYNVAYDEPLSGLNAIYIPGVGTPFPQIGENVPHPDGSSMGAMGAERIRYAILAIVNRMSAILTRKLIVPEDKIPASVRTDDSFGTWKNRLAALLTQSRRRTPGPHIGDVVLDVFGFSRGAAEARSFVNQLLNHFCEDGQFCGVPLRIRFMGLFDTVASVGYADSFPGPLEGHQSWGDQDLLVIPPAVEQCVHFVAGHEGRKSFPVDLVLGKGGRYPANCIEVVYPGVHSDIGGGYGPREQGRGYGAGQDEMLSQIPLNDMYERALAAGVALRRREKLAGTIYASELEVSTRLRRHFDHYLATLQLEGRNYPATRQYEAHLRYYLYWRREVLSTAAFSHSYSMQRVDAQGRINLTQSNDQLRQYVTGMQQADVQLARYEAVHDPRIAPPPADPTGVAHYRKYWPKPTTLHGGGQTLLDFFDNYVHDSRAGFTIIDPVTYYDHKRIHERLKQLDMKYRRDLQAYEAHAMRRPPTQWMDPGTTAGSPRVRPKDPLTARERENLAIYNKTRDPDKLRQYDEVPQYSDRHPGTYDDGSVSGTDLLAAMDGRREARWSYLHPRQHFAYSRLSF